MQAGDLVCIGSDSSGINPNLVPSHCYAVVGYDPSSSMPFELFNPWGSNSASAGVWEFVQADGAALEANFDTWGVAGAAVTGSGSQNAIPSADSPGSGTIQRTDALATLLAANSSQHARPGTGAAVHITSANASTRQPIVIGLAPTTPPNQLESIGHRHDHLDLALGSLMDEDLEFLRS